MIEGNLKILTFARHAARVAASTFALVGGSSDMEALLAQLCGQLEASAKGATAENASITVWLFLTVFYLNFESLRGTESG